MKARESLVLYLPGDQRNFLAELPELSFETPHGRCYLRGGHRLWIAPETWPLTQLPEDQPVTVAPLPDGVRLIGAIQPHTGVRKSIALHLSPDKAQVRLSHRLENCGESAIQVAPWGITMLPLGGIALLPQIAAVPDADGLQPNRLLAFWPYTRLDDPRLLLRDDLWQVRAAGGESRLKIGCLNLAGWAAYANEGRLLVKRFIPQAGAALPDLGSNCEVYTDAHTLELESLGPLASLPPGGTTEHEEVWQCYPSLDDSSLDADIRGYMGASVNSCTYFCH